MDNIFSLLRNRRFTLTNEKVTQSEIANILSQGGIVFQREFRLDEKNIIDFFCDRGTGIEVKLRASKKEIYRQCLRYCQFDDIKDIILVTNTALGFPKEINGKPVLVLNLGKGWL